MNQQNQQPEKQKEHNFDPELLKQGLKCDRDQYEFLKECSKKGDEGIKRWNEYRISNPMEEIWLQGADLYFLNLPKCKLESANLKRANIFCSDLHETNLSNAHLENADLRETDLSWVRFNETHLEDTIFWNAKLKKAYLNKVHLENADLQAAYLEGCNIRCSNIEGANFHIAQVDSSTLIWKPKINRYSKKNNFTNFSGVSLDVMRIDPGSKQLLEYNIRRMNWEEWYKEHSFLKWLVKTFWWMSDYGLSTWRIIGWFFGLAVGFAILYRLFPNFIKVYDTVGGIRGFWHALYFSVVTMTTLGFGDIAANPDSWFGQTLLMAQVILGYVLLGALVTRFAVLFTAGGPAGKFADEKTMWQRLKELWNKIKKKG